MMLQAGFVGAITRYFTGETIPVAIDAVNEAADGTRAAQRTVAREFAAGIVEGIEIGARAGVDGALVCPGCGERNDADARFCKRCGTALESALACARCGAANEPDARFCTDCGAALRGAS
ncbi:MAG: zinc ribbon domain-containing protein [Planctomycetota bacterium]|nr:MAG: zinc ribbon domain-containing protein [Planctomycetota bacterium]